MTVASLWAGEAVRRDVVGRKLAAVMVVCSAECYRARVNRRTAALMREKQRMRAAKGRRKTAPRGRPS